MQNGVASFAALCEDAYLRRPILRFRGTRMSLPSQRLGPPNSPRRRAQLRLLAGAKVEALRPEYPGVSATA